MNKLINPRIPKRKEMKKSLIILFNLFFVTGCSFYKSQFPCKPGKGLACMPAYEVNELIDKGYNPTTKRTDNYKKQLDQIRKDDIQELNKEMNEVVNDKNESTGQSGVDKGLRVYIPAHKEGKVYFEESYIYLNLNQGEK